MTAFKEWSIGTYCEDHEENEGSATSSCSELKSSKHYLYNRWPMRVKGTTVGHPVIERI